KYYEIPVIIVSTKADKIPQGKWKKHESMIKKKLDFDKNDQLVIFSSENRHGYDQAWDAIVSPL
ncbi:YihA family ribosome biogenesis GTP-binding protein, partial [Streptococcus suis]